MKVILIKYFIEFYISKDVITETFFFITKSSKSGARFFPHPAHLFPSFFFFHLLETIQMPNGKVMKRTMEYYSVIRRKAALLILAWMKCKEIMLNGKIDLERMHTTRLRRVTVMK